MAVTKVKKDTNVGAGARLRSSRINLGRSTDEFAKTLGISEDHYRKLESGATGLSADKLMKLYREYNLDPTYLVTGQAGIGGFNFDHYIANCSKAERDDCLRRLMAYMMKMIPGIPE